jgi:hypothetical protein
MPLPHVWVVYTLDPLLPAQSLMQNWNPPLHSHLCGWSALEIGWQIQGGSNFPSYCILRYMQIYNEKVFDLLNPNATIKAAEKSKVMNSGLRIRCAFRQKRHLLTALCYSWGKDDQFFVENLFIFECDSAEQVRYDLISV